MRAAAALDRLARRLTGRALLPGRWLLGARLAAAEPSAPPSVPASGGPSGKPAEARDRGPALWMHAASLGECKGLWALAEGLLAEGPPVRLILTTGTATGLAYLEGRLAERPGADARARLAPPDHPGLAARFLESHGASALVLCEAELWPNWIRACVARGLPVLLVSARMPERTFRRLRLLRRAWGAALGPLAWIQAQGEADAARFRALAGRPVAVGGDFKAAAFLREAAGGLPVIDRGGREAADPAPRGAGPGAAPSVREDRIAFVSLHRAELELLLPELRGLMARSAITVFPRRPEEFAHFRALLLPLGFRLHGEDPQARHVLVDEFGRVGGILPRCHSAFVGGSLVPKGCHNLWEPLLAGLLVRFGPSVHHQEDLAGALLAAGLAERVTGPESLRGWRAPGDAHPAACRAFAAARLADLEAAEAAFRARVADAMGPFYLFSGAGRAGARPVPRDKGT